MSCCSEAEEEHEGIPIEEEEKAVKKKARKEEKRPELEEGKPAAEGPE